MTKILCIGDIHVSDVPPSLRTATYTEDILKKIEAAVGFAQALSCEAIVLAGDVFHIKTPTRNSHALVQRLAQILTAANIPVWIVPGNHDMSNDRIDSLSRQPLGTLALTEGIDLLIGPHETLPIFGLPYLHDWQGALPKWMHQFKEWSGAGKGADMDFAPLMVTHAPLFPPGETPPYEFIDSADWAKMMENGDCYYGHIHDPHGSYSPNPEFANVRMCNNGAISRGSLHEATLKREPKVTLWDSELVGDRFKPLPLPFRPVEAVFRLQEKEDVDEKSNRVEEFLEEVGTTTLDGLSMEEVTAQARARGLKPRTLSLIEELVESTLK